jgi:deoxyadenosine/deoxycytidine kinase
MPDEIIFLNSDVDKCHENTKVNAGGEEFFTREYLERCRLSHNQLLKESEKVVHVVEVDPDDTASTANHIMGIVQQVKGVEIEMLPGGPVYPDIISIEGNVGAGKSTLLNAIKEKLQLENRRDIVVFEEPIAEWTKITDGTKNILHCLYEAPDRYAFAFQTLVALTTMKANFVTAYEHPEARVILCERSLLSSRYVFAEALKDEGAMNAIEIKVYEAMFKENVEWMYPKKNIYLKTSPESCTERIRKRGREEERGINIEWSRKYQGYYDRALYREEVDHPIIIEGDSTNVEERGKWVDQVLSICDSVLGIPTGYDKKENAEDNRKQDRLHEEDEDTPVRGEVKMSIKVRYRSRICRVGSSEDSLSQLREEVKRKWPRIMEENVGFTWKKVKDGPPLSITTEEELREALDIMSTQGRPVARLVITEGNNKGHYQGIDIPFDS